MPLTRDILNRLWPTGDSKIPDLRLHIAGDAADVFRRYGLDSDLTIAHALAQFTWECRGGGEVEESLYYTAERMMQVWPSRFPTLASAQPYARNPEKLANKVYSGRMGNGPEASGDGWAFRGRGGAQTTGRDGYKSVGEKMGLDLIANPDLVNDPNHFLECAVADFVFCGCLPFAKDDDVSGVTLHLNGGYTDLSKRAALVADWKTALAVGTTQVLHSTAWIQDALNRLGADPALLVDGSYGPITRAAVMAFQQRVGIDVDGYIGRQTLGKMDDELAKL